MVCIKAFPNLISKISTYLFPDFYINLHRSTSSHDWVPSVSQMYEPSFYHKMWVMQNEAAKMLHIQLQTPQKQHVPGSVPASLESSLFCLPKNSTDAPRPPTLCPRALGSHSVLRSHSGFFVKEIGQMELPVTWTETSCTFNTPCCHKYWVSLVCSLLEIFKGIYHFKYLWLMKFYSSRSCMHLMEQLGQWGWHGLKCGE